MEDCGRTWKQMKAREIVTPTSVCVRMGSEVDLLMRLPDVMRETALCRSSIYAAISEGRFPSPVRIGKRAVAWRKEDIDTWKGKLLRAGPALWEQR
ncbi:MAG: helix-turn-helix transcriptional regulator [Caulobacteraceae bacterium]